MSLRRVTQTVQALTTRIFRCRGLAHQPAGDDRWGTHDAAFWLVCGALGAGWYFGLFQPQKQRNEMLEGRQDVLEAQRRAEEAELRRLEREMNLLENGDRGAWERAARARLGWQMPGEVLDIPAHRRAELAAGRPDPAPPPRNANTQRVQAAPRMGVARNPAGPRRSREPLPAHDSALGPARVSRTRQAP